MGCGKQSSDEMAVDATDCSWCGIDLMRASWVACERHAVNDCRDTRGQINLTTSMLLAINYVSFSCNFYEGNLRHDQHSGTEHCGHFD